MFKDVRHFRVSRILVFCVLLVHVGSSNAQEDNEPGHSIGKVSKNALGVGIAGASCIPPINCHRDIHHGWGSLAG